MDRVRGKAEVVTIKVYVGGILVPKIFFEAVVYGRDRKSEINHW